MIMNSEFGKAGVGSSHLGEREKLEFTGSLTESQYAVKDYLMIFLSVCCH
jgi:hypothetical protein